ncbi:hypothetical protein WAX46_14670 [Bacillus sp. FJAT-53060]|nr:hypothetical protein [Bacillus stratosphericus]
MIQNGQRKLKKVGKARLKQSLNEKKDKYLIPEGWWSVMEARQGWVPMED